MASYNRFEADAMQLFRETNEIDWKPVENSKICAFFAGKHILITGATGFLGKLVVEKLLRACPNLAKIYIIVREKKGQTIGERIKTIYNDPVYGALSKLYPNFREKIHVIPGDISAPKLNLTPENETLLTSKLNVIFHVAANVRFDDPLPNAIKTNVRSTRDVINIAHRCPNLNSFVYVSTAYSNAPQKDIGEKFYSFSIPVDDLIEMAERKGDDLIAMQTEMIQGWPNTYTYSKAAAEECVRTFGAGLPICVIRPAIVIATYKEPLKCWIDNVYGATGIVLGTAVGLLKTMHCCGDYRADLVPGDYVINAMIAAAHTTAIDAKRIGIMTYNYVPDVENPICWKELDTECMKWSQKYGNEVESMRCFSYFSITLTPYYWFFVMQFILLQFIPACLFDFGLIVFGQKPKLITIYKKSFKYASSMGYFCTKQWSIKNDNTKALWSRLDAADKEAFPFSMADVNWKEYHQNHLLGLRMYLLKDSASIVPGVQIKCLFFMDMVLKALFYYVLSRFVYFVIGCFSKTLN